jgi:galactonate dehydratase
LDNETIRNTVEKVSAIRKEVGDDVDVCIDLNGLYNISSAVKLGRALEPFNLLFYEDPINQIEGAADMRRVKESVEIPICTGEELYNAFDFRRFLELNAVDVLMPDLVHCGGISQAKKIASMGEVYHVPIAPHNISSPLATIISAQVCASIANFLVLEFTEPDVPWRDEIISEPLKVRNGYLELPTKPGLGVDIVEEEIGKERAGTWSSDWVRNFEVI